MVGKINFGHACTLRHIAVIFCDGACDAPSIASDVNFGACFPTAPVTTASTSLVLCALRPRFVLQGRKKKFIENSEASTFHVVHRSQQDKAAEGEEAPSEFVLIPSAVR